MSDLYSTYNDESDWWFHGRITIEDAESLITSSAGGKEEGLFLIRESTSKPGCYTLTMWAQEKVRHFRIIRRKDGQFSFEAKGSPVFRSIEDFVAQHQSAKGRLPCKLSKHVIGGPLPSIVTKPEAERLQPVSRAYNNYYARPCFYTKGCYNPKVCVCIILCS